MTTCTYSFQTSQGDETIKGMADMKAFLALNGVDAIVASGKPIFSRSSEAKALYSRSNQPTFYSALTRAIEEIKTNKADPRLWKGMIKNLAQKGVKPDEVEWTGVNEWLDLQTSAVTKEQVLEYLNANGVQVAETMLGDKWRERVESRMEEINDEVTKLVEEFGIIPDLTGDAKVKYESLEKEFNDLDDRLRSTPEYVDETKYAKYTVAGGKNYKELLLTLPTKINDTPLMSEIKSKLSDPNISQIVRENLTAQLEHFSSKQKLESGFKSSHFVQRNILAHVRFDERTDADGNKVLFINEIQSDWGQDGKKKGFVSEYVTAKQDGENKWDVDGVKILFFEKGKDGKNYRTVNKNGEQEFFSSLKEANDVANERRKDVSGKYRLGIKPAPFVTKTDAWVGLAMKRMMRYAAENGFDKVAFISGEQASDLYDLSEQVDSVGHIKHPDGTYRVWATKDSEVVQKKDNLTDSELEAFIGKDIAKKIIETSTSDFSQSISGVDLRVGGEGMRTFYNSIVPKVAKDVLKKLGGNVEYVSIQDPSLFRKGGFVGTDDATVNQTGFTITSEMREKVMGGLPLFNRETNIAKGLPKQAIQNAVNALRANWKNAPEIIVVQDMRDPAIRKAVRDENQRQLSQGAEGQPEGFFDAGKVYIVASEMNSADDVIRVVFHETLGHYGLRGVYGDKLDRVLDSIYMARRQLVLAKATQYGLDFTKQSDRRIAAEEVLAEMAQTNPQAGFVQRAIAAIRQFLRDIGVKLELSDNDIIVNYLLPARNYVVNGSGQNKRPSDVLFNRADVEPTLANLFKTLAGNDEAFKYGRSDSKSLQKVFDTALPNLVRVDTNNYPPKGMSEQYFIYPISKGRALTNNEGTVNVYEDGRVEVNVLSWDKGQGGSGVYAAVGNFAYNNNYVFAGDRDGITADGKMRRLENMISLALKFGTTDHIMPHEDQLKDLKMEWKEGDTQHNLQQMLEASYRIIRNGLYSTTKRNGISVTQIGGKDAIGVKKLDDLFYNVETNQFIDKSNGKPYTDADFRELAGEPEARATNAGWTTLKRAAIAHTILEGTGEGKQRLLEQFGRLSRQSLTGTQLEGVLYSRSTPQTETPQFKAWFGDSKVVDADGKPLVVYHGSEAGEFTVFNKDSFFSPDRDFAEDYGDTRAFYLSVQNPFNPKYYDQLKKFFDSVGEIQDTYDGTTISSADDFAESDSAQSDSWEMFEPHKDAIKRLGFDGMVVTEGGIENYLVFEPNQIKSAIGNNGQFDSGNPDIRFSRSNAQQSSLIPKWDAPTDNKLDDVVYALQDKHIDLKRVSQSIKKAGTDIADRWNAYLQEELYHGRTAKRTQDFIKNDLDPLIEDMRMRGVAMADFEEYLWARHAEERNIQIAKINPDMPDAGSGMSTKDARDYLAGLTAEQKANYQALAKRIDDINRKSRQVLVDYGLESKETIAAWEGAYKNYVPLMREDMDAGFGNGTGQGFSVKGNAAKRATGSNRAVVDVIANIAQQFEKNVIRGEKNRVSTALIGLAELNPNKEFWQVDNPPKIKSVSKTTGLVEEYTDPNYKNRNNVVVARTIGANGKVVERAVVFNQFDKRAMRMAGSIKNLDQDQVGELLGMASSFTRYFASINTQYNPIFGVINIVRDVQGALLNLSTTPIADKKSEVIKNTPSAWLGIYQDLRAARKGGAANSQWADLFEDFQNEGGQTGFRNMYANAQDRSEAIRNALDPLWWQNSTMGKLISANGMLAKPQQWMFEKAVKPIFDWLSDYNTSLENAVRLSVYKVALDNGHSKQQAASMAKNISVNFNRKGEMGRQIGALYAFFNASVQGTARIGETLLSRDDAGRLSLSTSGKRIVQGGLLLGAMQALLLASAGYSDDEPPEFVRDRSLIMPLDMLGADGKYLTLPMPLGFNAIPSLGRILTEWALSGGDKTQERLVHILDMVLNVTNPIGNAGLSLQTIAPTVIDPLAALAENKDFTGRPIAREDFNSLNPTAGFTRSRDKAWDFSVAIARAINWITGGNDYKQGAISPTADQLEYLAGQFTGGVGREIIKAGTTADSLLTGEDLPTYKIPLVGRFVGDSTGQASQGAEFYANVRTMNEYQNEIKGIASQGGDISAFMADHPEARMAKVADLALKQVQNLRKQQRALKEAGDSREQVKMIDERITAIMTRLNENIRELKETAE